MSIQFGEINIVNQLLDNTISISVLQKTLEYILNNNQTLKIPTQIEIEMFKDKSAQELKDKYPNSGIEYKK